MGLHWRWGGVEISWWTPVGTGQGPIVAVGTGTEQGVVDLWRGNYS